MIGTASARIQLVGPRGLEPRTGPTLVHAFREHLGVTPKAYLRAHRLNGVHRDLVEAGPGAVIADVTNCWGFWHMGQFAADYRQHFQELPSETLAGAK